MDFGKFEAAIATLFVVALLLLAVSLGINTAEYNIQQSCDLTGTMVIDSQAYQCEKVGAVND